MKMPKLRFKADDGSDFPEWQSISLDIACEINPETETLADQFYYMDLKSVDSGQWTEPKLLQKSSAPSRARRVAVEDDVFFQSVRPYNKGHYHFTQYRDRQVVASTGFIQTRMRNGSNSFLYHLFFTDSFNAKISFLCAGSNYPAINSTEFGKIVVSFPSASEQHKIAKCLDAIDLIIAKQQAEIKAWEQYKKGLTQKLFSQEVRFKADDGSDFPAWESIPLAMACDINPKTEPLAAQFYYMDLNSVDSGQWNEPQLLQRADAPSRAQRVATLDDVFFQSVRPYNQGHYHITRLLDKQIVASTGFIQTRMRNGCNSFLYHMFFEEGFNKEINLRCTGSNYPAINATEFGKIVISLPSSPEQRKIAECLDAIDEVIALAKAELEKWHELKKGLLQQLFV